MNKSRRFRGTWWGWDPRLSIVAILLMAFLGITALRHYIDDAVRRATWSSVATVVGYFELRSSSSLIASF